MEIPQLSALLVDDENLARANLRNLISTYCTSIRVIGEAANVQEGLAKVKELNPDVIFLDVSMPKQNGFELVNRLPELCSIVFVTAHEQYALPAMKVCAVDFLLKPIDINELRQTEIKLQQVYALKPEIRKNYSLVLRNLSSLIEKPGSVRKLTLYTSKGYEIFEMEEIMYLSADNNYTTFHFEKHKPEVVSKTLKDFEEILSPFGFMRVHKSTVVNLSHIKRIVRKEIMEIVLTNGIQLQVSRRKAEELLVWSKNQLKIT